MERRLSACLDKPTSLFGSSLCSYLGGRHRLLWGSQSLRDPLFLKCITNEVPGGGWGGCKVWEISIGGGGGTVQTDQNELKQWSTCSQSGGFQENQNWLRNVALTAVQK